MIYDKEVQGEYLNSIAKACTLGLIRLTGKRKLKLELCAEFGQVVDLIRREDIDSYYDQIDENVTNTGMLLMAYTGLSIDQFFEIYSANAEHPFEKNAFEKLIYWNGTMNHALTTFYNEKTGANYLTLPDMQQNLHIIESIGIDKLFQAAPRDISRDELDKWKLGFNMALPEWDTWLSILAEDEFDAASIIFEKYKDVAAGTSMTELIMHDLRDVEWLDSEPDDTDILIMESDCWHTYAEVCLHSHRTNHPDYNSRRSF